jgi:hypothetical protein
MALDKREHPRYNTNIKAFASLGNGLNVMGSLRDICKRGSAIEYIDARIMLPKEMIYMDIFVSGAVFHLEHIECSIIYNSLAQNPFQSPIFTSTINTKRCGIFFEALSEKQSSQLDYFLEHYTTGLL